MVMPLWIPSLNPSLNLDFPPAILYLVGLHKEFLCLRSIPL